MNSKEPNVVNKNVIKPNFTPQPQKSKHNQFELISSYDIIYLEKKIKSMLDEGWKLYSGIKVVPNTEGSPLLLQAMIKELNE